MKMYVCFVAVGSARTDTQRQFQSIVVYRFVRRVVNDGRSAAAKTEHSIVPGGHVHTNDTVMQAYVIRPLCFFNVERCLGVMSEQFE